MTVLSLNEQIEDQMYIHGEHRWHTSGENMGRRTRVMTWLSRCSDTVQLRAQNDAGQDISLVQPQP